MKTYKKIIIIQKAIAIYGHQKIVQGKKVIQN